MRHAQPKQYFADAHRAVAYGGAIEWEELPSLARRILPKRPDIGAPQPASAWDETRPGALGAAEVAPPFREPLEGLATREVTSPEVFQHFFGDTRR